jgi:hypothetical protein
MSKAKSKVKKSSGISEYKESPKEIPSISKVVEGMPTGKMEEKLKEVEEVVKNAPEDKKIDKKEWFKVGNDYEKFWKGHLGHDVVIHCKDGSEHAGKLKGCLFQQMNIVLDMEGHHRVFRGDAIDWVDIPRGKIGD